MTQSISFVNHVVALCKNYFNYSLSNTSTIYSDAVNKMKTANYTVTNVPTLTQSSLLDKFFCLKIEKHLNILNMIKEIIGYLYE